MSHSALLLDPDLTLRLARVPDRAPRAGEVLVDVAWAGVCGSDLHVLETGSWVTDWPAILGHEICGRVLKCPGGEFAPGQPLVVDSRVPCGRCAGCARAANLCQNLAWLGECRPGGYQQRVVVPVSSVVPTPRELPLDVAVLAEPLAVAQHAVGRSERASGGDPGGCLVLGGGPIGLLVALLLADAGAVVNVVEPDSCRRQLAAALGATVLPAVPPAARWRTVIDAAGYATSLPDALAAVERGGVVTMVALPHAPVELVPADLVERQVVVLGSLGFDAELPKAVEVLAADPARFRPLISEALDLDEAPARLARWRIDPPAGKVVIRP